MPITEHHRKEIERVSPHARPDRMEPCRVSLWSRSESNRRFPGYSREGCHTLLPRITGPGGPVFAFFEKEDFPFLKFKNETLEDSFLNIFVWNLLLNIQL